MLPSWGYAAGSWTYSPHRRTWTNSRRTLPSTPLHTAATEPWPSLAMGHRRRKEASGKPVPRRLSATNRMIRGSPGSSTQEPRPTCSRSTMRTRTRTGPPSRTCQRASRSRPTASTQTSLRKLAGAARCTDPSTCCTCTRTTSHAFRSSLVELK